MDDEYELFRFVEECVDSDVDILPDGSLEAILDVSPRFLNLCVHKLKCLSTNDLEIRYYENNE